MRIGILMDPQFSVVLKKLLDAQLELKVAYKLYSIKKIVDEESAKYEKLRLEAVNKFADKKEDGSLVVKEDGSAQFTPENMESFVKELNELLNVEFAHGKLKFEELGDKLQLSASELASIESILDV